MKDFNMTVYFLRNPNTGIVKVGKTENFENRYKSLCAETNCKLEILLIIYAEDTEKQLHSYFSDTLAYKKEWFTYDDRMKELIEETLRAGHLVFPEGQPYKDLPIDQRRKVKQQHKQITLLSDKINNLSDQVLQVRRKRDEYKQLSSSGRYYKEITEGYRLDKQKTTKKIERTSWFIMLLSIILLFVPSLLKINSSFVLGRLLLLDLLVSYVATTIYFYLISGKIKKRVIRRFTYLFSCFTFILSIVIFVMLFYYYLFGG